MKRLCLVFLMIGWCSAQQVAPNPGGPVVVTNSTTATVQYSGAAVTQRVDNYSTTVSAQLNGRVVFSQTLPAAFTDATVQAAVAQADAILQSSKAVFGAPAAGLPSTTLQSTVVTNPSTPTCDQLYGGAGVPTGVITNTTSNTFGPTTLSVGGCHDELFNVLAGQLDININVETEFRVPGSVVTTNTFLTTQTYTITGTGTPSTVPAISPAAAFLLALGLCGVALRQRSWS